MIALVALIPLWLGVFGFAWIIADSKITFPIRTFLVRHLGEENMILQLLECPSCLSFWIGLVVGYNVTGSGIYTFAVAFSCVGFSTIAWAFVSRNP